MAPNIVLPFGEADFLLVTWAGVAYEYEIKTSRQDFKNDLKKDRNAAYSVIFMDKKSIGGLVPNYFTYIIADGVNVTRDDIPPHAGAYFVGSEKYAYGVGPYNDFSIIKPQKRMHPEKLDWTLFMAKSLSYRYATKYIHERSTYCHHCGKDL
jgi:hypothetical protein